MWPAFPILPEFLALPLPDSPLCATAPRTPDGRGLNLCREQFTLQPSLPGAAITGSNSGDCDIKGREAALPIGAAYNELEEDAEGNGMTADAASLGVSRCRMAYRT